MKSEYFWHFVHCFKFDANRLAGLAGTEGHWLTGVSGPCSILLPRSAPFDVIELKRKLEGKRER